MILTTKMCSLRAGIQLRSALTESRILPDIERLYLHIHTTRCTGEYDMILQHDPAGRVQSAPNGCQKHLINKRKLCGNTPV